MVIGAISNGISNFWQKTKSVARKIIGSPTNINKADLHSSDKLGEKCGVFGIFSDKDFNIGETFYTGLTTIQNRGQDACGVAYSAGTKIIDYKDEGMVNNLFNPKIAKLIRGKFGIGHTLYTTSRSKAQNEAPTIHPILLGEGKDQIALVHNGNLPEVSNLKNYIIELAQKQGFKKDDIAELKLKIDKKNDSGLMAEAIHLIFKRTGNLRDSVAEAAKHFNGSFALIVMSNHEMVAARDPKGVRPLYLAKNKHGSLVLSSETTTFDALGIAGKAIEVLPGEILLINESNIDYKSRLDVKDRKHHYFTDKAKTKNMLDFFEWIYFSKPQSKIKGKYVSEARRDSGKELAREYILQLAKQQGIKGKYEEIKKKVKLPIDVVVPIPESGIPSATGFAEELGLPINPALIKNFHRRTFIDGGKDVRSKFALIRDALAGKNVALVDDSIVKGNTSQAIVKYLKAEDEFQDSNITDEHKPDSIHFFSASPPIVFPDHLGIDIPDQKKLIAYQKNKDTRSIAKHLGSDSVKYLSLKGMCKAFGITKDEIEHSKVTGHYAYDIGEDKKSQIDFKHRMDSYAIAG
jgi:amidophosphoribosyltransferase